MRLNYVKNSNYEIFTLIIFLLLRIVNFVQCEHVVSCTTISNAFQKGRDMHILHNDPAAEFLAKNEIVVGPTDPNANFFFFNIPPTNLADRFRFSTRVLRGLQFVFDKVFNNKTAKLRPLQKDIIDFYELISACISEEERCPFIDQPICNSNDKYRIIGGFCNNLQIPRLGTAFTPLSRWLLSDYSDTVQEFRKSFFGDLLPSPRKIQNMILKKPIITTLSPDKTFNTLWFFMAQIVSHDLSLINSQHHNAGIRNGTRCCSSDYKDFIPDSMKSFRCAPMSVPSDDYVLSSTGQKCLNYVRMQTISPIDCLLKPAEQANTIDGYLDLSVTYGNTLTIANNLRTFVDGTMKTNSKNVMLESATCSGENACFVAGDSRVNQQPPLALMQSVFVRCHNHMAAELKKLNAQWNDETLYQEARRICIAIYQHILYFEYLPDTISNFPATYAATEYDPNLDGTTLNDFTTGPFRTQHLFTPDEIIFTDENGQIVLSRLLSQMIGKTGLLNTFYKEIVYGMMFQKIKTDGFSFEMANIIVGISFIVFDIQRGRDSGLQPYGKYREACGLSSVKTFDDLNGIISSEFINDLKLVYASARDIDLYVGGILEIKSNTIFGPTFECILRKQFLNSKFGDRFFYTHTNTIYPFTETQRSTIAEFTIGKLLCLLIPEIKWVPKKGFFIQSSGNPLISCNSLNHLNLKAW